MIPRTPVYRHSRIAQSLFERKQPNQQLARTGMSPCPSRQWSQYFLCESFNTGCRSSNLSEAFNGGYQCALWDLCGSLWLPTGPTGNVVDQELDKNVQFLLNSVLAPHRAATSQEESSSKKGRVRLSFAVTEPTGNKPDAIQTMLKTSNTADNTAGNLIKCTVTGEKSFISGGRQCTHALVVGRREASTSRPATTGRANLGLALVDVAKSQSTGGSNEGLITIEDLPILPFVSESPHAAMSFKGVPGVLVRAPSFFPPREGSGGRGEPTTTFVNGVDVMRAFRAIEDAHFSCSIAGHLTKLLTEEVGASNSSNNSDSGSGSGVSMEQQKKKGFPKHDVEVCTNVAQLCHSAVTMATDLVIPPTLDYSVSRPHWAWDRSDHGALVQLHSCLSAVRMAAHDSIPLLLNTGTRKKQEEEGVGDDKMSALKRDLKVLSIAAGTRDARFMKAFQQIASQMNG